MNYYKRDYKRAQHAIRNLRTYGNTVMGHDYFLRRIRTIPLHILVKAYEGLNNV